MGNFLCFIDESYADKEKIFCLGGVIIVENNLGQVLKEINRFKQSLGLVNSDFIKFSLGSSGEDKKIKDKIKNTFTKEHRWLTDFRNKVLEKIASLELTLISSLHQDVRRSFFSKKSTPVDFYLPAFRFLIQRIWWIVKDITNTVNIMIVIDNPPGKNAITKICNQYKEAYHKGFSFDDSNIPPLKDFGFLESPFVSKSDFNTFIQISDFCVGAIKERGKDLINNNREAESKEFIKKLLPKFYKINNEDIIGKGIVVFPRERELYNLMKKDVQEILKEVKEGYNPF